MKSFPVGVVLVLGLACTELHAGFTWLDDAYIVASQGSITPISVVSLSDPPPWLYLDLSFTFDPALNFGLSYIWFTADWSHQALGLIIDEAPAATPSTATDKLWIPAPNWGNVKAAGNWNVTPYLNDLEFVGTYGVGVYVERQTPGTAGTVSVVTRPVPDSVSSVTIPLAFLALAGSRSFRYSLV